MPRLTYTGASARVFAACQPSPMASKRSIARSVKVRSLRTRPSVRSANG